MYSSDDDSPAQQQSNAGSNQAVFGAAQAGFGAAPAGFDTADNASVDSADLNNNTCLLYTSPSPRDGLLSRMPSSA